MNKIRKGFFVTGTDTNVGKTIVSAILVYKLNGIYWKPIQCGTSEGFTDTEIVRKILKLDKKKVLKEKFFLREPISPNLASRKEKIKIKAKSFKIVDYKKKESLIVEGAGGILVPINKNEFVVDIIKKINLPLILVSSTKLGTINHTLMSLEVLFSRKQEICGIVFVGPDNKESIKTIYNFSSKINGKPTPILGRIPIVKKLDLESIRKFSKLINI